jgi:uncharacterized membrane protein YdbT with pleckstrin-like domain
MQKLNPKATWLFFFMFLGRASAVLIIFITMWILILAGSHGQQDQVTISLGALNGAMVSLILATLLYCALWARLSYRCYRYELRDEGIRIERGVIWKKYVTIPYDRIQNVDIMRGLIARILGLSDLQVQTAGAITAGSYGAYSEGRLPGLAPEIAEQLRDEVFKVSRQARKNTNQGGL